MTARTIAATVIGCADDLIVLLEPDAARLEGVRMTDIDLVTGVLRVLLIDGRRFEITAIEIVTDDEASIDTDRTNAADDLRSAGPGR